MKRMMLLIGACLLVGLVVLASPNNDSKGVGSSFGFAVSVEPDQEFADITKCGMSIFSLVTEENVFPELPSLQIAAGDYNSMSVAASDGFEVTFSCSVDAAQTEATYEIAGRAGDRLVMNHIATVRLK